MNWNTEIQIQITNEDINHWLNLPDKPTKLYKHHYHKGGKKQ